MRVTGVPEAAQHAAQEGVPAVSDDPGVRRLADRLTRLGLSTPAIVVLELLRPVGFLCGQALWVLEPIMSPVTGEAHRRLARSLEDGRAVDRLLSALEGR